MPPVGIPIWMNPKPVYVVCPALEPETFCCTGGHSSHLSHTARAVFFIKINSRGLLLRYAAYLWVIALCGEHQVHSAVLL